MGWPGVGFIGTCAIGRAGAVTEGSICEQVIPSSHPEDCQNKAGADAKWARGLTG